MSMQIGNRDYKRGRANVCEYNMTITKESNTEENRNCFVDNNDELVRCPITQKCIQKRDLFKTASGHCFSKDALLKHVVTQLNNNSEKLTNPSTNQELVTEDEDRIIDYLIVANEIPQAVKILTIINNRFRIQYENGKKSLSADSKFIRFILKSETRKQHLSQLLTKLAPELMMFASYILQELLYEKYTSAAKIYFNETLQYASEFEAECIQLLHSFGMIEEARALFNETLQYASGFNMADIKILYDIHFEKEALKLFQNSAKFMDETDLSLLLK